ncbi:MAG TPA: Gfo/Idh/MocA family oxidoreductase [Methylomirabilota bacterium]|jgi:myo-inositol 2-dehydrogenase/D-chiro-inositol 1-dehydrogenase|nr:Gfo/Idh/MocA family oxidoreductase [Methylomirabilota bacterium]
MTGALRLGFAGCGEVAVEKHMPAVAELRDIEVVAVADADPQRLDAVHRRFGVPHRYADVARLLAHPGLEAVAICLPPRLQVDAALAAVKAGKHVWVEPPLGLSLGECDRLIDGAAESTSTVIVGFHMRWHRLVQQARDIVRSGRLGPLQSVRAVWNSPRDDDTLPEWRRHRRLGGGALVEIALEHFDLWRHLLESEVEEIFAYSAGDRWEDEAAVVSGRMASGVLVSAVLSERANHAVEFEIAGKAGRLRVACIRFEGLEFYPTYTMPSSARARLGRAAHFLRELPAALPRMHRAGDYRLSYREQWRHFHDAIRTGAPVGATLADGRQALAVTLAAAESTVRRRPIIVGELPPTTALDTAPGHAGPPSGPAGSPSSTL